jgi:MFS family permease
MFFIPWGLKLVYGFLSDSVPLFGYRRKTYLFFNGILGFLSVAILVPSYFTDSVAITVFLIIHMVAVSFNDAIGDSIMVVEAKRDKKRGSEDLQTLSFLNYAVSGILASLLGAFFTQYIHPRWGLALYSLFSLAMALAALQLNEKPTVILRSSSAQSLHLS